MFALMLKPLKSLHTFVQADFEQQFIPTLAIASSEFLAYHTQGNILDELKLNLKALYLTSVAIPELDKPEKIRAKAMN